MTSGGESKTTLTSTAIKSTTEDVISIMDRASLNMKKNTFTHLPVVGKPVKPSFNNLQKKPAPSVNQTDKEVLS